MPTILGRNPFHHKIQSHSSNVEPHSEHGRSSRSFLGFMNKTNSDESTRSGGEQRSDMKRAAGSMNELKRFFRPSMHRRPSQVSLRHGSPEHHSHTQSAIPPSSDSTLSLSNRTNIYHDDSLLAQKYGKLGKILGSGAGGSVRVLVRPTDGATFAVKEFRPRKPNEQVKDYAKKCTAEFCIGSTLHHPNIVETLDIFSDSKQNKYFEVMEYCPIDFFAVVMSGKMTRGEINCCLRQLSEGVRYLHSMGLAHRDLKLDNCVMTHDGILKLIDFGSAVVFKYPFEADVAMAHGIVGSDPYLAPEVITSTKKYDPQLVDIWSIGIIYCCMMLKRFPWKAPRESDDNFRLYCMPDDSEHDYVKSAKEHEILMSQRRLEKQKMKRMRESREKSPLANSESTVRPSTPTNEAPQASATPAIEVTAVGSSKEEVNKPATFAAADVDEVHQHNDTHESEQHGSSSSPKSSLKSEPEKPSHSHRTVSHDSSKPRRVIHGPYRLLRLLPHASRPVMSRILQVDPKKRATLEEVFQDDWFGNIPFCTIDDKKNVIRAPGHSHTIVREEEAHLETYKV